MTATYATATDTGRVREANEDALLARPPMFMVADGMGGAEAGEVAASAAVRAFQWFDPRTGDPAGEVIRIIKKVNDGIYQMSVERGGAAIGTTLTGALIDGDTIILAHVGDSRAYVWRDGMLRQLTEDHSLVGEMVRQGTLSAAEANEHPQRSIITRAIGVEPQVDIDVKSVEVRPGDVFLLCSDGLYSMVADDGIADVLGRAADLEHAANALVEEANTQGGHDNISVVLFCPDGSVAGGAGQQPPGGVISAPAGEMPGASSGGAGNASGEADPEDAGSSGSGGLIDRLHLRWFFRTLPGQIALGMLIAILVAGGGWLGTRQIYFLGVQDGRVAMYRGIPYSIGPFNLYSLDYRSPVRLEDLEQYEQDRLAQQDLHFHGTAQQIIDGYSAELRKKSADQAKQQDQQKQQLQQALTGTTPAATPPAGTPPSDTPPVDTPPATAP